MRFTSWGTTFTYTHSQLLFRNNGSKRMYDLMSRGNTVEWTGGWVRFGVSVSGRVVLLKVCPHEVATAPSAKSAESQARSLAC